MAVLFTMPESRSLHRPVSDSGLFLLRVLQTTVGKSTEPGPNLGLHIQHLATLQSRDDCAHFRYEKTDTLERVSHLSQVTQLQSSTGARVELRGPAAHSKLPQSTKPSGPHSETFPIPASCSCPLPFLASL